MQALQKHVGRRIREIRERKGLSQEALAAACRLHRTYIGLIERGQRNLTVSTIETIARELEVPATDFFVDAGPGPEGHGSIRGIPTLIDLAAHLATIRNILIDAKLVDEAGYEGIYKSHRRH